MKFNSNIKELYLPKMPPAIVKEAMQIAKYPTESFNEGELPSYYWYKGNTKIQEWCNTNIADGIFWGIQVIEANLAIHRDVGNVKFNYIIDQGGNNVHTNFYANGVQTESIVCDTHRWYLLNVQADHNIHGLEQGKMRISITGRVF